MARAAGATIMERAGGWRTHVAAIVAAMIILASPARAGCSLEDVGQGFYGTLKATKTCESACDSEESCGAAVALAAALTMVALEGSDTGKGQALVDQFCKEAQGTSQEIVSTLNLLFANKISEELLGDLSSQLAAVGAAAKVVQCACETEQYTNSFGSALGDCLQEGLCSIGIDWGCKCERPPTQTASCPSIRPECKGKLFKDPTCIPASSIANCNATWQQCGYAGYGWSVAKVESSDGTLGLRLPPTAEGTGCDGAISCFCPKPMEFHWYEIPNPGSGDHRYLLTCDCPEGTHPGATMPSGISSCLCNETNKPANFGFAPFGMCPPPACPAGQVRLGGSGDCITPCADPTQGMAFDGSCCDSKQMSTCGTCCPPDTIPDPKNGTCVPRPKPPK
jgi:hypothetical protein